MTRVFRYSITSGLICCLVVGFLLSNSRSVVGSNKNTRGTTDVVLLGRSFTLRAGRQVTLKEKNLRIKFIKVEEDSRCPSDVTCIWAGNAAVRLEVSAGGKDSKSMTLNTSRGASFNRDSTYRGYKLRLVGLNPYPQSTQKIAASDYTATLLVSKE